MRSNKIGKVSYSEIRQQSIGDIDRSKVTRHVHKTHGE